jgi:hypothetical protein
MELGTVFVGMYEVVLESSQIVIVVTALVKEAHSQKPIASVS